MDVELQLLVLVDQEVVLVTGLILFQLLTEEQEILEVLHLLKETQEV
jgi:hypothetical protein|tara:strand:- start:1184 stop:1324 length:141 start_codon:yes stop_codon:yes gene_type:complete